MALALSLCLSIYLSLSLSIYLSLSLSLSVCVAFILRAKMSDPAFAAAADVIGIHYPAASTSTPAMVASGHVLWASEDSSSNDNEVGTLVLGQSLDG